MRKRTAARWMLGVTVASVLGMVLWPGEQAVRVRVRLAQVSAIEQRVDGSGVVGRTGEYAVSSPTGGVIEEIYVTGGDAVKAGQALFKLDTDLVEQALVDAARARSEQAALLEENGVQGLENGIQTLTAASQSDGLMRTIAAGVVRARADGQVLSCYARAGEVLLPGAPAMLLAQAQSVVRLQVGERESLRLSPGMRARFLRDDRLLCEGSVQSVGLPGIQPDGVLTAQVTLTPDEPLSLPPGARVDVEIILASRGQALLIPVEALCEPGDQLWQVNQGRAFPVKVETGLADAFSVQVTGLAEGALVILDPPDNLKEGQLIEVTP